jgi:hypothetical protein
MLSPNATTFFGSLFPKSKSVAVWLVLDEVDELLLPLLQPTAARNATPRHT